MNRRKLPYYVIPRGKNWAVYKQLPGGDETCRFGMKVDEYWDRKAALDEAYKLNGEWMK